MFVDDAREQLRLGQTFEYTNNFLQSVGNIQLLHNARLLLFYWPIVWFTDLKVAQVACSMLIAAVVFTSVYATARLLLQPWPVAAAGGWILGFLSTPFVSVSFFYPILLIAPHFWLVVVTPVVTFWLIGGAGRSSNLFVDACRALGLVAWAFYVLAGATDLSPVIALGTLPYIVLAIVVVRSRQERWRKVAVLAAAAILATMLRWPWYLFGAFADTAANLFPNDFTVVYIETTSASILFQGRYSWAGPFLILSSSLGGLASLKAADSGATSGGFDGAWTDRIICCRGARDYFGAALDLSATDLL